MALYLVQHGKSKPKTEDPDQGLSAQGIEDTRRIAATAKGYQIKVARVRHSGKTRARQTADIFAAQLAPEHGIEAAQGLKPTDDVTRIAAGLRPEDDLMLVGHLPFMERMASFLITGDAAKTVFKFQNSGIVCLDTFGDDGAWAVKWALMPEIG